MSGFWRPGTSSWGSPVTKDQPDAAMEAADLPSKPVPISTDQAAVGLSQGNAVIRVAQASSGAMGPAVRPRSTTGSPKSSALARWRDPGSVWRYQQVPGQGPRDLSFQPP